MSFSLTPLNASLRYFKTLKDDYPFIKGLKESYGKFMRDIMGTLSVCLSSSTLEEIEALQRKLGYDSRSKVIRLLIKEALQARRNSHGREIASEPCYPRNPRKGGI